jgi:hypothetical protein
MTVGEPGILHLQDQVGPLDRGSVARCTCASEAAARASSGSTVEIVERSNQGMPRAATPRSPPRAAAPSVCESRSCSASVSGGGRKCSPSSARHLADLDVAALEAPELGDESGAPRAAAVPSRPGLAPAHGGSGPVQGEGAAGAQARHGHGETAARRLPRRDRRIWNVYSWPVLRAACAAAKIEAISACRTGSPLIRRRQLQPGQSLRWCTASPNCCCAHCARRR